MPDTIAYFQNSLIQYGEYNDRIYLIKLAKEDFPNIIKNLNDRALDKGYSKIFAKIPAYAKEKFEENGFMAEAFIPRFINGHDDVYFMGKYFSPARKISNNSQEINQILKTAKSSPRKKKTADLPSPFKFKVCELSDAFKIGELYKKIFDTYPFPIYDPKYILKTMQENVIYFSIWKKDTIIALASSEMDIASKNVEMTDFATLAPYRGKALSQYLLKQMENEMSKREIKTAYTIARALSVGINITFAKMGYTYGGTLKNNTNICGRLESMNVWYKFL